MEYESQKDTSEWLKPMMELFIIIFKTWEKRELDVLRIIFGLIDCARLALHC